MKQRRFVDSAVVHAQAGRGGDGCLSFRREKYVPKGGPDGGDGGRGGHVFVRGNRDVDSLIRYHYSPHQRAGHAGHGKGKQLHGRNGRDLILDVPCGTEIRDGAAGTLLVDIVRHDERFLLARGGRGGLGNCHWARPDHRAPREHTAGREGEAVTVAFELKLMANAGLVGYPNAGKSSLLRAISHAHPRIGAYPFTTLNPVIGTLVFPDHTRITVADIPGLIEGAHAGAGLGDRFLRHVERAACLLFVVDIAGVDGRPPDLAYACLQHELSLYKADLARRPSLVVANKMDLPGAQEGLAVFIRKTGIRPIPVSAVAGTGIASLKAAVFELWQQQSGPH